MKYSPLFWKCFFYLNSHRDHLTDFEREIYFSILVEIARSCILAESLKCEEEDYRVVMRDDYNRARQALQIRGLSLISKDHYLKYKDSWDIEDNVLSSLGPVPQSNKPKGRKLNKAALRSYMREKKHKKKGGTKRKRK